MHAVKVCGQKCRSRREEQGDSQEERLEDPVFEDAFLPMIAEFSSESTCFERRSAILRDLSVSSDRIECVSPFAVEELECGAFIPQLCRFVIANDVDVALPIIRHTTILSTEICMMFLRNGIGEWVRRKMFSGDGARIMALKIVQVWSGDSDACRQWLCFHHYVEDVCSLIWVPSDDKSFRKAVSILSNLCACEGGISPFLPILEKTSKILLERGELKVAARVLLVLGESVHESRDGFKSLFRVVLDVLIRHEVRDVIPLFLKFLFLRAAFAPETEELVAMGVVPALRGLVDGDSLTCKWTCFVLAVVIEKNATALHQFFEAGYMDVARNFLFEREYEVMIAAMFLFSRVFLVCKDPSVLYAPASMEVLARCFALMPSVSPYFQEKALEMILVILTDEEKRCQFVMKEMLTAHIDELESSISDENRCQELFHSVCAIVRPKDTT